MSRSFGTEMSGISFLTLAAPLGAGLSGSVAGLFGVLLIGRVYTRPGVKRELFKCFQGGTFRERRLARCAGQEVDGFADGHGDTKIEAHPSLIAGRTGHLFEPVGYIRLCTQVEVHIRVDREAVATFLTDTAPLSV